MRFAILSAFGPLLLAGLVHAVPVEDVNPIPASDEEAIPDAAGSGWFSNSSENQTKFQESTYTTLELNNHASKQYKNTKQT